MTKLSPAAQAVLDAAYALPLKNGQPNIAAALRAAADKAPAPDHHEEDTFHAGFWAAIEYVQSIATELEASVVHLSSITDMPPTLTCNLTYFKKTGKFYDKGSFDVAATHQLFEIWEHVRARRDEGRLPGLVDGAGREFMVLVDVPGHPHEHPHLIV